MIPKEAINTVEISVNIPAIVLIMWAFCRLFLRWFSDYYYTEFGMVLDLIAIIVLFYLAKEACQSLKLRHRYHPDTHRRDRHDSDL